MIELPTEFRWRCQKCGKDVPEAEHVALIGRDMLSQLALGAYGLMPPVLEFAPGQLPIPRREDFLVPLSGPPERGHEVSRTTGGRPGVMGGWTRHTDVCGPLRLTLIDTQELWVEHVMGAKP